MCQTNIIEADNFMVLNFEEKNSCIFPTRKDDVIDDVNNNTPHRSFMCFLHLINQLEIVPQVYVSLLTAGKNVVVVAADWEEWGFA